jgi:sec-independent protein translocase protein TatA
MGLDNPLHIAFLVVILLLVFGARRLPEIGRSLGSGMREFKDSISGESSGASSTASSGGAASSPVKGGQPALTQAVQPSPPPPVAQPAPTDAQAPVAVPVQPPPAPVEQSR